MGKPNKYFSILSRDRLLQTALQANCSHLLVLGSTNFIIAALWKDMCFKCYPLAADRYHSGDLKEPESWREQFFVRACKFLTRTNLTCMQGLRQAEAKRFEELGSRLRFQRLEAEERKKEKEVKLTDRIPPSKRSRTGCK
jgi:hypothetical protein